MLKNGKRLLMIVIPATCSENLIADTIAMLAAQGIVAEKTTPLLLSESDFSEEKTTTKYKVRAEFERAVKALKKVCGSPRESNFYRNTIREYFDGHIETPIEDVLKSMTLDERAWLCSLEYEYLIRFIDALPYLV